MAASIGCANRFPRLLRSAGCRDHCGRSALSINGVEPLGTRTCGVLLVVLMFHRTHFYRRAVHEFRGGPAGREDRATVRCIVIFVLYLGTRTNMEILKPARMNHQSRFRPNGGEVACVRRDGSYSSCARQATARTSPHSRTRRSNRRPLGSCGAVPVFSRTTPASWRGRRTAPFLFNPCLMARRTHGSILFNLEGAHLLPHGLDEERNNCLSFDPRGRQFFRLPSGASSWHGEAEEHANPTVKNFFIDMRGQRKTWPAPPELKSKQRNRLPR